MAVTHSVGWEQLINVSLVGAAYSVYNEAFFSNGFIIVVLFMVFNIMLYLKTKNIELMFIIGALFTSIYATSSFKTSFALKIIFIIFY